MTGNEAAKGHMAELPSHTTQRKGEDISLSHLSPLQTACDPHKSLDGNKGLSPLVEGDTLPKIINSQNQTE